MASLFYDESELIKDLLDTIRSQYEYLSTEKEEQVYREWIDWLGNKLYESYNKNIEAGKVST